MNEVKEAVYVGSRNLYPHMAVAARSLAANSSVDRIWLVIEDAVFPHELPGIVETVDMSRQGIFPAGGPNFKTRYSYLCLLRACYTKFLPTDARTILQLDVDTVCVSDVDPLFETGLGDSLAAMCDEAHGTFKPYGPRYYNAGVALLNLERIRAEHVDERLVNFLNSTEVPYIDQDAWNFVGNERVIDLDKRWNECAMVGYTDNPGIVHFAGHGNRWTDPGYDRCPRLEHLRRYREMTWDEAMGLHAEHAGRRA